MATANVCAVDQVVVDERRLMHKLDGNSRRDRRRRAGGRGEKGQRGAQPLASRSKRIGSNVGDNAGMARDRHRQPVFNRGEVVGETAGAVHHLERRGSACHAAVPVWSATIVPASSRKRTSAKPAPSSLAARSSAPGNRRTLAGRYA